MCQGFVVCEKVASIDDSSSQRSTDRGEAVSSIDVEEKVKVGAYLKTKPEEERIDKRVDHFDRATEDVLRSQFQGARH